jgi:hypothetical protein
MKSTVKRFAAVAAVGTMAILAPVASAHAAVTPLTPAAAFTAPWSSWGGAGLGLAGLPAWTPAPVPYLTGGAVVVGPVIITTAPSSFINTNNQVSAGGNLAGGQVSVP